MVNLQPCPFPVDQLLPQAPPMVLIDEVLGWNDEGLVAGLTIRPESLFCEEKGVAAHIAIEWMAQACGAFVGAQALEAGQPVRLGFLLGTRNFAADIAWFAIGDRAAITVRCAFHEGEMAVFDCSVARSAEIVASAQLTLFQPADLRAMLSSQGIAAEGL